jgi:ATP-dependent helicase Lhr and Lhr-like helicase
LQIAFRRLEDRGEVRGGRFVSGFQGEQFALPVAVESLRASRRKSVASSQFSVPSSDRSFADRDQPSAATQAERIVISAADPLNLVGILIPGERVPAISGRSVTFRDGMWQPEAQQITAAGD